VSPHDVRSRVPGFPATLSEEAAAPCRAWPSLHITWRSFWNGPGGIDRGIARTFLVRGGPIVYILDGKGVIRFTKKRDEAMDAAVDQLLAETKKGQRGR